MFLPFSSVGPLRSWPEGNCQKLLKVVVAAMLTSGLGEASGGGQGNDELALATTLRIGVALVGVLGEARKCQMGF